MPLAAEKIITRNWGQPDSWTLQAYKSNGGYAALEKALGMQPAAGHRRGEEDQPARPRRRRLPHRHEVELRPQGQPQAQVPGRQRRRVRAGHLQGPLHPRERPAHAARGHRHRRLRASACTPPTSTSAASSSSRRSGSRRPSTRRTPAGIFGKKRAGHGLRARRATCVRGAGAYICGEETALLESLEGKKGWPRLKPPFPAVVGLFGCPTIVNNVETLATVPAIIEQGRGVVRQARHREVRRHAASCASRARVNRPGVYELLACSTTVRELIDEPDCGGMPAGRKVKAVIPGGSSAPVLAADELDVALEFEALKAVQTMAGSGGVIVMDDATCMVALPVAHHALLRRRVLRPVHALPRGHAVADARSCARSRRAAASRRHRDAAQRGAEHRALPAHRPGQHHLRARRRGGACRCTASWRSSGTSSRRTSSRAPLPVRRATPWGHYGAMTRVSTQRPAFFCSSPSSRVVAAAVVIAARNPITSAMSLVATFFCLGGHLRAACSRTPSPCFRSWSTPARSWCCSSS